MKQKLEFLVNFFAFATLGVKGFRSLFYRLESDNPTSFHFPCHFEYNSLDSLQVCFIDRNKHCHPSSCTLRPATNPLHYLYLIVMSNMAHSNQETGH